MKKVGKKTVRSTAGFGTLDDFLEEEGKLREFEAIAIREARAPTASPPPANTVRKPVC